MAEWAGRSPLDGRRAVQLCLENLTGNTAPKLVDMAKAPLLGFRYLISGGADKVIVAIQTRELDPALWQGDYENDAAFRQFVQNRVTKRWEDKDTRIAQIRAEIEV